MRRRGIGGWRGFWFGVVFPQIHDPCPKTCTRSAVFGPSCANCHVGHVMAHGEVTGDWRLRFEKTGQAYLDLPVEVDQAGHFVAGCDNTNEILSIWTIRVRSSHVQSPSCCPPSDAHSLAHCNAVLSAGCLFRSRALTIQSTGDTSMQRKFWIVAFLLLPIALCVAQAPKPTKPAKPTDPCQAKPGDTTIYLPLQGGSAS